MPDTQTTEYRATQLVYSIKIKLSHATTDISTNTDRWCNRGADRANGEWRLTSSQGSASHCNMTQFACLGTQIQYCGLFDYKCTMISFQSWCFVYFLRPSWQPKQNLISQFFILLHYMFQPSGPDHMLNKTGTVLKWFPPSSLPRKWKSIQNWKY